MRLVTTIVSQFILVFTSPFISIINKLAFGILYPISLARSVFDSNRIKQTVFLDRRSFFFYGRHFNLLLNHIYYHLKYYFPLYKNSKVIIDIGASYGTFPRIAKFLSPNVKVYSVEMVQESYDLLVKNCSGLRGVEIFHLAMGDKKDRVKYSFDPDYPEGGNIGVINYSQKGHCEQTTLDQFVQNNKINRIDLLKIDAEGYESKIFTKSKEALKTTSCILVEVQFNSVNLMSVIDQLNKSGFYLHGFGAINLNTDGGISSADIIFKKGKHRL